MNLLAVQGTLKSLLQHHSSKASSLQHSTFFIVQLSHPYMTTGKTIALTRQTFVGKVMSLLFNMLSRLVIDFLPRNKRLLITCPHFADQKTDSQSKELSPVPQAELSPRPEASLCPSQLKTIEIRRDSFGLPLPASPLPRGPLGFHGRESPSGPTLDLP